MAGGALVFIGFMGAGKSTAAREAAAAEGRTALDSDSLLERELGMPIEAFFEREGEAAFREALAGGDAEAAAAIAPGDRQRLVRARAVLEATGRPLSGWRAGTTPPLTPREWTGLVLEPARDALYARCDQRVLRMLEQGALDEVRALAGRGVPEDRPAMKATGVRELTAHLRVELTREEAVDRVHRETRTYAKRQLTWLPNQTPHWPRLEGFGEAAHLA